MGWSVSDSGAPYWSGPNLGGRTKLDNEVRMEEEG
jgi:hypothetical protein